MNNDEMQFTAVFIKITELVRCLGVTNINQIPGAWFYRVNDRWEIAVNGHGCQIEIVSDGERLGCTLDGFNTAIWYNGWLVGILTPVDGILAAGCAANEDALIDALDSAIARATAIQLALL